jgi:rhodanese-related sulfurtransferase
MSANSHTKFSLRTQISVVLICFAIIAWVLPERHRSANELKPSEMIPYLNETEGFLTCDQVARIVVEEDPSVQLLDIREPDDYLKASIPGAINIPFSDILNPDWSGYLDDEEKEVILYSDGDILASQARLLCIQSGYDEIYFMKGGLDQWEEIIMGSEFTGERISAAENALFETRYRARDYFTTMNSLPDSLKTIYLSVKRKNEAELVGGCE